MHESPRNESLPFQSALTIEDVAQRPLPGSVVPQKLAFSPDDQWITYLLGSPTDNALHLYALGVKDQKAQLMVSPQNGGDTESNLSIEEQLRRQRQRQFHEGVSDYSWAHQHNRFLFPMNGALFCQEGVEGQSRKLVEKSEHPTLDPQFSPDDQWVAYVQDSEIYVVPSEGGTPKQLTEGARGTGKVNGLADYIAQEEMDRNHGFWWSPDSRFIAFTETDESHIPEFRIMHLGKDFTGPHAEENHRFPFVGKANSKLRLGVIELETGKVVWMDFDNQEEVYLPQVRWLPDGQLSAQIENRAQSELKLLFLDPQEGTTRVVLKETSDYWIDLLDLFRPLKQGGFIWGSQKSGFFHLYLYNQAGNPLRILTRGEWMVTSIVGVDEDKEMVYFTANCDDPGQEQLYSISFSGGPTHQITQGGGMHHVILDHSFERFIDVHHSTTCPPSAKVCSLVDGETQLVLHDEVDPRLEKMDLVPPEMISIKNRDGVVLHGALYRPPKHFGEGPFPTLVNFYGGPHTTRNFVNDSWGMTVDMRAQYLSRRGILVFKLDNQGTGRRGIAFTAAIKNDMGNIEVKDQVDGVNYLIEQKLAIPGKIGVHGWSYGGYLSAMCLARAPETFDLAIAGAPVTHQDGYDTHYTERIMGTPESNPKGYEESSVMHHVDKIKGKLLLVHGLMDENVHFRHTARLINALIEARKPYDLIVFPDGRHSMRKPADLLYLEEQLVAYLEKHWLT